MAGRPEFESVIAQTPRERLMVLMLQDQAVPEPIPPGGEMSFDFFMPVGFVGVLQSVNLFVLRPSYDGATSGQHSIEITDTGMVYSGGFSIVEAPWDEDIFFNKNSWKLTKNIINMQPDTDAGAIASIKGAMFDDVYGFRARYINDTDATKVGQLSVGISYVERMISK